MSKYYISTEVRFFDTHTHTHTHTLWSRYCCAAGSKPTQKTFM